MQVVTERRVSPGDLLTLRGEVRVVQLLDLAGDRERRVPARHDFMAQEARAAGNLFHRRPVEERIERSPVVVQLRLEAGDAVVAADERFELGQRRHARPPELGDLLPVLGRPLACHVEEVVAHENAGEAHVRSEPRAGSPPHAGDGC